MLFFCHKSFPALKTELSGLRLDNPIGVLTSISSPLQAKKVQRTRPGFITVQPPRDETLSWIASLQKMSGNCVLAVNLKLDMERSFSLFYDFPDMLIIDPDSGAATPDVSEISDLMDRLLSLRLCYERYKPTFLRIPHGLAPDEVKPLLDYCQLSGVDGVVVSGLSKAVFAREQTLGRLPVIAVSNQYEEALSLLIQGFPLETELNPLLRLRLLKSLDKQQKKNG